MKLPHYVVGEQGGPSRHITRDGSLRDLTDIMQVELQESYLSADDIFSPPGDPRLLPQGVYHLLPLPIQDSLAFYFDVLVAPQQGQICAYKLECATKPILVVAAQLTDDDGFLEAYTDFTTTIKRQNRVIEVFSQHADCIAAAHLFAEGGADWFANKDALHQMVLDYCGERIF